MIKIITGVLLVITSTYALADGTKIRFLYDIDQNKILKIESIKETDIKKLEKCIEDLKTENSKKIFKSITKDKKGKISLTYYCRH